MKIFSLQELEQSSLRNLLRQNPPEFILQESNNCFAAVIETFEDCPEALADFDTSDWMNLAEPYTYQLLERWTSSRDDILEIFEEFKNAYGFGSTMEAMTYSIIEDPEDLAVAITNAAMTFAARTLLAVLEE